MPKTTAASLIFGKLFFICITPIRKNTEKQHVCEPFAYHPPVAAIHIALVAA
jgi:hypothetical protein